MGQPIAVIEKPSSRKGIVRYETNRALTGMGHERYVADQEVWGDRPPDELARRLFARGGVAAVHVNGNIVTIDLDKGWDSDGLKEIVETLYIYYPPEAEGADEADPTAAGSESSEVAEATAATVPVDDEGAEHAESVVETEAGQGPEGPAPVDAEVAEAPEGATAVAPDAGTEPEAAPADEPDNETSIADAAGASSASGDVPLPGNQSGPDDDPAASAPI